MSRNLRRLAKKNAPTDQRAAEAASLFMQAVFAQQRGQVDEAIRLFKKLLTVDPDHAEACNNLGHLYLLQGKPAEAAKRFAQALALLPQLLDDFSAIQATLFACNPALAAAAARANDTWPQPPSAPELLGTAGIAAIADDALLLHILQSTMVRSVALERLLTVLRRAALIALADVYSAETADRQADARLGDRLPLPLSLLCALARQNFINEYVYAVDDAEQAHLARVTAILTKMLAADGTVSPHALAVAAMYGALGDLPHASMLLKRSWTSPFDDVITQQVREPHRERELRDSIARLTPIDDDVSRKVRAQYEENPYPRWVHAARARTRTTVDDHLRKQFPQAQFASRDDDRPADILVAGCGTGRHPIEVARTYSDAHVLAIDLSLSSLAYATRKTPADVSARLNYAQADIMRLGALDRRFDLVDSSGVLHHMADPLAGWRILLGLVRPGGFMHVGLYSSAARQDIVAARAFIAEHAYPATPDGIRRCRQDILASPLRSVANAGDFFGTSECRDLLFHVQEHRFTLPAINAFLTENNLHFIGLELEPARMRQIASAFEARKWSLGNLDHWHAFETEHPETFTGMYQFWIQKV